MSRNSSPFIARLVNETGITGGDGGKVGYYAGLIVSALFSLCPI